MKLCVFPNDPIIAYFNKGEVKKRYFNPNNFFDEVHIISPIDSDINEQKGKKLIGDAELKIHPIGKLSLMNYRGKLRTVIKIIENIQPNILRSYNPLMQGWLAAKAARKLSIPLILSLHNNYDKDVRGLYLVEKNYKKYIKFWYTSKFIEPFVLSNATKIICSYRYLVPYAKRLGGKNIEVIYNRVDLNDFSPTIEPKFHFDKPTIIYVARMDPEKNHETLIRAIKGLDVKLLLIGDGPLYAKLKSLGDLLGVKEKIIYVRSVPNEELVRYYNSADIFVSPLKQGGVSIPMLEAMACGLPLIIPQRNDDISEDIDDVVIFAENNPEGFQMAISSLIKNPTLLENLEKKSLSKVKEISGEIMELKEENIYKSVLIK